MPWKNRLYLREVTVIPRQSVIDENNCKRRYCVETNLWKIQGALRNNQFCFARFAKNLATWKETRDY